MLMTEDTRMCGTVILLDCSNSIRADAGANAVAGATDGGVARATSLAGRANRDLLEAVSAGALTRVAAATIPPRNRIRWTQSCGVRDS